MANRFLTRDEVLLEVGIPCFRLMIKAAASKVAGGASELVTVPNLAFRDCLPVVFRAEDLTPEAVQRMMAALDQIEAQVRARIG